MDVLLRAAGLENAAEYSVENASDGSGPVMDKSGGGSQFKRAFTELAWRWSKGAQCFAS